MGDGEGIATPKTFSDYPPELLRFFDERKHAEEFLAGIIRLGSLRYYKCDADRKRNDPSEGRGLITPGSISFNASYVGPLYILSCTDPQRADIAKLKEKFGKHVVRITDPRQLGQQLTDKFSELNPTDPFAGRIVQCCRVRYDENRGCVSKVVEI